VLVGFYDDIVISISDKARIGAIILAVRDRIGVYDAARHRVEAKSVLIGAGYSKADIEPWLEAITEP
ncbi:Hypothetical protein MVR_LOCUS233, partial [uncultured virus]